MRTLEDLLRGALLFNTALVHEYDLVRHFIGKTHFVGDQQHGHALLRQALDHAQHLANQFRVEGRGDFVEQHQAGVHRDCTSNRHTLLLAAGQLPGEVVAPLQQADTVEPFFGQGHGFVLAHFLHLEQAQSDVLQRRQVRKQVELLERHAGHRAVLGNHPLRVTHTLAGDFAVTDRLAIQGDLAALEFFEQVDATQQRGLARAAGADQGHHVAALHGQVDAFEHFHLTVLFAQAANVQQR